MTTDGGGWTVFQNRYDGSVDFYRNYSQYEHGFGDLQTEFWLDLMSATGTRAFEVLSPFSLSAPNYLLNVGNTTSSYSIDNSRYSFGHYHHGQSFSTYDHDVDSYRGNCAKEYWDGGWWFKRCYHVSLNGVYGYPGTSISRGIYYYGMNTKLMKQTRMSFRKT